MVMLDSWSHYQGQIVLQMCGARNLVTVARQSLYRGRRACAGSTVLLDNVVLGLNTDFVNFDFVVHRPLLVQPRVLMCVSL